MDISRDEQRILHLLAQGGRIEIIKHEKKITQTTCFTSEGQRYGGLDLELFRKLKRRRAIASHKSGPYRITRRGLELVRSQLDNR